MTAFLSAGLAGIAQIVPEGIRDAFSPSHSGIVSAVLFREVTACRFSAISSRNPSTLPGSCSFHCYSYRLSFLVSFVIRWARLRFWILLSALALG